MEKDMLNFHLKKEIHAYHGYSFKKWTQKNININNIHAHQQPPLCLRDRQNEPEMELENNSKTCAQNLMGAASECEEQLREC